MAALKHLAYPFGWIAACWLACFTYCALHIRTTALRLICVNGAIFTLAIGLWEVILHYRESVIRRTHLSEGAVAVKDDWLGWAPPPSTVIHARRTAGDSVVFDVRYTNDSFRLRVVPPPPRWHSKGTVAFFGCSFAYGAGLNDDATLPYQVSAATGGSYRVINFAGGGYGPHQMLSALEHGLVDKVVGRDSITYAVYEAIPGHIARAVGRVPFHKHAPRYRLASDGRAQFVGRFDDPPTSRLGWLRLKLEKSALFRFLVYDRQRAWVSDADLHLYLMIVRRSRDLLVARYPGARFEVLLWGDGSDMDQRIADGLGGFGIPVHRVPDILPDFEDYLRGSKYRLSRTDAHPDSVANALLARYLIANALH